MLRMNSPEKGNNMQKPKIAIVGASIAGCACAIILDRANQDVTVFEQRTKNTMVDRGAGITLPRDLVTKLKEKDLLDQDFPSIDLNQRTCYGYDKDNDCERLITSAPIFASSVHWGSVYNNLAKRLPAEKTRYNTKVTAVSRNKKIHLTINQQEKHEFDIVIFADGYASMGRNFLFPAVKPEFVSYIAWRGTLNRVDAATTKQIYNKLVYYGYKDGHILIYPIPGGKSAKQKVEYSINWVLYETVKDEHPLLRDNKAHENIAPTAMTAEYITYLHKLAKDNFPSFVREIITTTEGPYTQAISDALAPAYFADNIALVGDASILLRPHAGSGATKALDDALNLEVELANEADLFIAMDRWAKERHQSGTKLFKLGRTLGDFLVTHIPAWDKLDQETLDDLWNKALSGHSWYITKK